MKHFIFAGLLCLSLGVEAQTNKAKMTEQEAALAKVFAARLADWRNGALVYQVFVDRFAPSQNLDAKRSLYAAPRTLKAWTDPAVQGHELPGLGIWSHELDFWGGDLKSLEGKLDYIHGLGMDVVYLNPVQLASTNHKYDATDWAAVSPEYGTRQDVADVASRLHAQGMKLMLDGVFNHMGRNSPKFQEALKDPKSPYRDWFFIGPEYNGGYRMWANVRNLPEVKIENPAVRKYIWDSPDSVVQKYLTEGVDGWRLDTAYELGPAYLEELTQAAHRAKPGSAVIGEIWNYPEGWYPALDGVMNFYAKAVTTNLLENKISASVASRMLERMVSDAGIDHLLKSWLVLDNHDTSRLASIFPDVKLRHLAQVLQFTLPGSPVVYYGAELGMAGAGDPGSRGSMRWDLATDSNPELQWMKRLISIRRDHPALKVGDYRALDSDKLLAFSRRTDRVQDTVVVVVNASNETVTEPLSPRDGRIMNGEWLRDELGGTSVQCMGGLVNVTMAPHSARIYRVFIAQGYTPYKRMH